MKDLLKLRQKLDEKLNKKKELEMRKKILEETLQELGFASIEKAQKHLEKLQQELKTLSARYNKLYSELEEILGD